MQNQHQSPSSFRPIIPAPQAQTYIPTSPFHMSQVSPSPHSKHGAILPPFETPPDSPFSQALHNDYSGQGAFKLPPPLQPLSPLALHGSQSMLPPSPTSIIQQQNASPSQSSHSRYERILPKQLGPLTSVFSVPVAPPSTNPSLADQRELARKVSHSAIERRRRERINDKIMQLKELIPSCADQDHLHKLSILQSSIEYIQYLQELVITYRKREKDGGKFDNDESLEDGRFTKRSKFELESGIKKISDSEKINQDDNISATISKISDKAKNSLDYDHEEADALLMLSKSTTTTINNSKRAIIMKDSETQTSPTIHEWEKSSKESEDMQESENDSPRRGMTVQQLLC
ncbi:11985_t:CDS:2 [Gigaspora margarita]|uniref:11985_t:CDS:1 n=1 Tax=Gigaspora margarita TaxID=4874 RepID=A0ABN7UF09_GIGMA|nr:11985_t:CDS:2 [Gigaspora margarita]